VAFFPLLGNRQFALLWGGMTVSLIGDGIYLVAIAWESYALSDSPTALSIVGVAWTLPTLICLLAGGALSDRFERRRMMLLGMIGQGLAIGLIGVLALGGVLKLWMLLALVATYGASQAFFIPAFEAIIPTLVEPEQLTAASALDQFVRPLALQLAGPAVGGLLIALTGTGVAFLADAGTFVFAACALLAMRRGEQPMAGGRPLRAAVAEIADGLRFVRANPWLWGTLSAAALTLLAFVGPSQVLLPFLVKNELHASSGVYGAIRAIGGVGALLAAFTIAQSGLPGRFVTVMFLAWALQCLSVAVYAAGTGAWLFAGVSLLGGALGAVGNTVWGVLMKTLVPNELLGRVASLDWLVSVGLVPLSFALTGPVAAALGARTTLVAAGLTAGGIMLAFLAVPGIRAPERSRQLA
jgi:DHA3 family tetracycline resistance protein-like MFS transporter